jgi:phosphatidylglycerol:prolipoprotein diacylglycerol transferase
MALNTTGSIIRPIQPGADGLLLAASGLSNKRFSGMITIGIDPILFSIGHFHFRWYGLIVMTAIIVGVWLGVREAARKDFKSEDIYDTAIWTILGGLVGARLFHVLDHWSDVFAANPIRALYIWEGGLAIWGAVAGGLIVVAIVARLRGWRLPKLLDAVAPGLVLAQAIGRVACIITGDAMGKPTNGPFGFAYTNPNAMAPQLGVYYTPMPVYEIFANLGIFALLWQLRKRNWPDGLLFLVYLSLYSVERFFLGFTSSYQILAFGLTQSQIVALVSLVVAVPLIVRSQRQRRHAATAR